MRTNDPRGLGSLDSSGLIGRIYEGLLHTKHISSRPHGFREENFSILRLWELYGAMATRVDHFFE